LLSDRHVGQGRGTKIDHGNEKYIVIYRIGWQRQKSLKILTLTIETGYDVEHCMKYPVGWEFVGSVTNISPSDTIHCRQSENQQNHGGCESHPELPPVRSEECRPTNSKDGRLLYKNVCSETKFITFKLKK
jgi:hypothetical protein